MSLRDACTTAWTLPVPSWQPQVLNETVAHLQRVWGGRNGPPLPPFVLEQVWALVRRRLADGIPIHGLTTSERRLLPRLLFYPAGEPDQWLGADRHFCETFVAWLPGQPRALAATAEVLLREYPESLPAFSALLQRFRDVLKRDTGFRTAVWRQRDQNFDLFAEDGPARVAAEVCVNESPSEVFDAAGLTGDLAVGGFARAVHRKVLETTAHMLAHGQHVDLLECPLAFLEGRDHTLRFEDQAGAVADALLLPHIQRDPAPRTKARLERFLLAHFKDPRMFPQRWQLPKPESRDLMLRWMVGATLEDFFRLIGRNALMNHWESRKAFWSAYLKRDFIRDAWVVLGEEAARLARQAFRNANAGWGRLEGAGDKSHSVLLLRIGDLTIAEWSHNGKCRVWLADNAVCPRMHVFAYTRRELVNGADYEQIHHGNANLTWQGQLAGFIGRHTGARVGVADYRV